MFGISGEHILILGIILLIFGPRRVPELGNTMGKAIRNFKDALAGVEEAKFRKLEEQKADPHGVIAAGEPAKQADAAKPVESAAETKKPTDPA